MQKSRMFFIIEIGEAQNYKVQTFVDKNTPTFHFRIVCPDTSTKTLFSGCHIKHTEHFLNLPVDYHQQII